MSQSGHYVPKSGSHALQRMAPPCSSLVWGHPSCKVHAGMPHHLDFFKMWCPQQQKTCFTKRAATVQTFKTGHWGQQTGPLKSDEQVRGGKKNHLTPVCNFSKIPAAKKMAITKVWPPHNCFFLGANASLEPPLATPMAMQKGLANCRLCVAQDFSLQMCRTALHELHKAG